MISVPNVPTIPNLLGFGWKPHRFAACLGVCESSRFIDAVAPHPCGQIKSVSPHQFSVKNMVYPQIIACNLSFPIERYRKSSKINANWLSDEHVHPFLGKWFDHINSDRFSAIDVVSHAPRAHSRDSWAKSEVFWVKYSEVALLVEVVFVVVLVVLQL